MLRLLAILLLAATFASPAWALRGFVFSWRDNSDNETMFIVQRRIEGQPESEWRDLVELPANTTHYIDRDVQPLVRYEYRVAAASGFYTSEFTEPLAIAFQGTLANLSARGRVGEGDALMIGGFIVAGDAMRVLVRGIGPGLAAHGVPETLADPRLELVRLDAAGAWQPVAANDDWPADDAALAAAMAQVHAFPLPPGSADAALMLDLPPGRYTALLTSAPAAPGGIALLELYSVAP